MKIMKSVKSVRKCEKWGVRKCEKVWEVVRIFEKVWEKMIKCEKVWKSVRKWEKAWESVRKCEKVWEVVKKCEKVCHISGVKLNNPLINIWNIIDFTDRMKEDNYWLTSTDISKLIKIN